MIYARYQFGSRLGNWLFLYAVARSADRHVAWLVDEPVKPGLFDDLTRLVPELAIVHEAPSEARLCSERMSGETDELPSDRPLILDGYFQNEALLDRSVVQEELKCPAGIERDLRRKYSVVFEGRQTVGVHVRRGDYLKLWHRFPFVGKAYLRNAIERFGADSLFVVCSDDLAWCKRFFATRRFAGRHFFFVDDATALEHLYIRTFCTHNIISNSSYGWWGAYLNRGEGQRVVAPSRWFGPSESATAKGLYLPDAEIVPCSFDVRIPLWRAFAPPCLAVRSFIGRRLRAFRQWMKRSAR